MRVPLVMSCLLAITAPAFAQAPAVDDVLALQVMLDRARYGIHGTPEPSRIGHVQSHGCVRLTNWDVQRVAQWARPGHAWCFDETLRAPPRGASPPGRDHVGLSFALGALDACSA